MLEANIQNLAAVGPSAGREAGVRIVPGGSAVGDGAGTAPGVICMPPMYINVGAYVGVRAVTVGKGAAWGQSLATPVIVKYRDSRTDTRTELEAWIR